MRSLLEAFDEELQITVLVNGKEEQPFAVVKEADNVLEIRLKHVPNPNKPPYVHRKGGLLVSGRSISDMLDLDDITMACRAHFMAKFIRFPPEEELIFKWKLRVHVSGQDSLSFHFWNKERELKELVLQFLIAEPQSQTNTEASA